jgi:hypothetical protein
LAPGTDGSTIAAAVTFEDFRRWALDSTRWAALRWEEPDEDEVMVLLAADTYDAFHVIPVPPLYVGLERGHVHWLAGGLPDIVSNRSLHRLAFRTSAWASRDPKYVDQPVDDPKRTEFVLLHVAEKGRYEAWHAPITRSRSGLPGIGEWELYATDRDGLSGALPKRIRMALDGRAGARGPTMPAADMVLGAWDVPREYIPLESSCGPLEYARDNTSSTYAAVFGPESPGPVIVSQALVFPQRDAPRGHVEGAMQMLVSTGNAQFDGPPLVEESHYFKGKLDGDRLYRYTALWRSDNVFCELALVGPPGAFNAADLHQYAAIQARRAEANLESRRPMSSQ